MFQKLEDFFLNKIAGRLILRAGVAVSTYLASGVLGVSINVSPAEISALVTAAAHYGLEEIKRLRRK